MKENQAVQGKLRCLELPHSCAASRSRLALQLPLMSQKRSPDFAAPSRGFDVLLFFFLGQLSLFEISPNGNNVMFES